MQKSSRQTLFRQKIGLIALGLLFSLIILETILRIGGFTVSFLQEKRNHHPLPKAESYRILCLGESTTAARGDEAYPELLQEILNKRYQNITFKVINKGIPAITTTDILNALQDNLDIYKPHIVTTMIGINDQGTHMLFNPFTASSSEYFLSHFKTYKLFRLIWQRFQTGKNGIFMTFTRKSLNKKSLDGPPLWDTTVERLILHKAHLYKAKKGFYKALEIFKKALGKNPKSISAHLAIARTYMIIDDISQAKTYFNKALELNPDFYWTYVELGWFYRGLKRDEDSQKMFQKAYELEPDNQTVLLELGWSYMRQENYSEAEKLFEELIQKYPYDNRGYRSLSLLQAFTQKDTSKALRSTQPRDFYSDITKENYRRLKKIVAQRNIPLICIQYPMREVSLLKAIFEDTDDMIFVDNEAIFKEAILNKGYEPFFEDMFAGDFGHVTREGHRIIAKNIADRITVLIPQE